VQSRKSLAAKEKPELIALIKELHNAVEHSSQDPPDPQRLFGPRVCSADR
jgi:hypothetical protein